MTIKLIYKRRPQPGTLYPILIEFSIYKPYEQQWTGIDKKKLSVHLFLRLFKTSLFFPLDFKYSRVKLLF